MAKKVPQQRGRPGHLGQGNSQILENIKKAQAAIKKPKAGKDDKVKVAPPPFKAPELVRKPHKGKDQY